jgi:hypothetical protein
VQGDGARLLTPCVGNAAVQPPERGELRIGDALLHGIRGSAESGGRLLEVVLKKPGLGQRASNGELILTIE